MTIKNDPLKRREFLQLAGLTALAIMLPQKMVSARHPASKTALVYHPIYLKHKTGEFHPENPKRLHAILKGLEEADLLSSLQSVKAHEADMLWIEKVHQRDYIETVRQDVLSGADFLSTKSGNTAICPQSLDVALWAAGGVLKACDDVMTDAVNNAFCAVRPPGHHATPNRGMGFCLFNNVAVAARYLQQKYNLEKILIVDWDVHHGNGTQDIFFEDGSVFFFSTHQWPWYPGTGSADEIGTGPGKGTTLNAPLPAGSGDKEIIEAFEQKLWPKVNQFKPNFVLISAGFDSRNADPLGRFRVTDEGFRRLTRIMKQMADDHAQGRLVSVLEGGYNLEGLAQAVPAHIRELANS
jgi:acetoin utilization deacetylase AcuC-like enzyme